MMKAQMADMNATLESEEKGLGSEQRKHAIAANSIIQFVQIAWLVTVLSELLARSSTSR